MNENLKKAMMAQAAHAEAYAFGVYTIYAGILREAGMVEAAMRLEELAGNEKEHLEQWLKRDGKLGEPFEILDRVIGMEKHDAFSMYDRYLEMAAKNGAPEDLKEMLRHLKLIEFRHAGILQELKMLYKNEITRDDLSKEGKTGKWVCPHCGNYYYSKDEIPDKCPVCEHDKADYVWQEE